MKGITGLLAAAGLGLLGGLCNLLYLQQVSKQVERVAFVGIKADVDLPIGATIRKQHLERVEIPRNALGNLPQYAVAYDLVETVYGLKASRHFEGGELLLQSDIKAPPAELPPILPDQRYMFVPVNSNAFLTPLVEPGDYVSFVIPPTPGPDGTTRGASEILGPFEVLALGTRLGQTSTQIAAGRSAQRENILTVSVKIDEGNLEPKAERLNQLLLGGLVKNIGVLVHPRDGEPPADGNGLPSSTTPAEDGSPAEPRGDDQAAASS